MTCLILVGGLGTRLRTVLPELPKPMAPVGERPFLEYLLKMLKAASITEIVLCVGYKAKAIEKYFGDGAQLGLRIRYSHESAPAGTAGALKLAQPLVEGDSFLLLNGDCYNEIDFQALLKAHQSTSAVVTIAAAHVENRARYGSLQLGENRQITSFEEKNKTQEPGLINAGYYALSRGIFAEIPAGVACSLEHQIFPKLIGKGKVFAFETAGAFIDIGVPDEWRRAESVLPKLSDG